MNMPWKYSSICLKVHCAIVASHFFHFFFCPRGQVFSNSSNSDINTLDLKKTFITINFKIVVIYEVIRYVNCGLQGSVLIHLKNINKFVERQQKLSLGAFWHLLEIQPNFTFHFLGQKMLLLGDKYKQEKLIRSWYDKRRYEKNAFGV